MSGVTIEDNVGNCNEMFPQPKAPLFECTRLSEALKETRKSGEMFCQKHT